MDNRAEWASLAGTGTAEKLASLGIVGEQKLDIRTLDEISRTHGVAVYLFFEEGLARDRSFASVREEYARVPEYERPYIEVGSFLRFTRENDPSFDQTLREFPLMVTIVAIGELPPGRGSIPVPYVTGLMPFLDELNVDAEPGHN